MNQATARAGANIALVKYWGKRDAALNLPAAGSISITLAGLETTTTVIPDDSLPADELVLDGRPSEVSRVSAVLDLVRSLAGSTVRCRAESDNNFPTGAGLASSASGFAALVVAADRSFGLDLSREKMSELARRGSGSAARSIFGGFVEMAPGRLDDGSDAVARPLLEASDWPLEVIVAVTDSQTKPVSSTEGMNRTMNTSPYYRAWVDSVPGDLDRARAAIANRDFEALAETSEHSTLKMHASMLAAIPGLVYWNAATVACMHEIHALRKSGVGVFFTMDAGAQVKAICLPGAGENVARQLAGIDGVARIIRTGLGEGAGIVS